MALRFLTSDPAALLKSFKDAIQQDEPKGKITTWELSSDGIHFTHTAAAMYQKAFFKPVIDSAEPSVLKFNIIRPKEKSVDTYTYGYYHGHLTETFLNHFDQKFTDAVSTALPKVGDNINPPKS